MHSLTQHGKSSGKENGITCLLPLGNIYSWPAKAEAHRLIFKSIKGGLQSLTDRVQQAVIWMGMHTLGFPGGTRAKENPCQCRRRKRHGFSPWVGEIPWSGAWQPTPVFLPGESHGQRSLEGAIVHGVAKSGTQLKQLSIHIHTCRFWPKFCSSQVMNSQSSRHGSSAHFSIYRCPSTKLLQVSGAASSPFLCDSPSQRESCSHSWHPLPGISIKNFSFHTQQVKDVNILDHIGEMIPFLQSKISQVVGKTTISKRC